MSRLMPRRVKVGGILYTIEFRDDLFETDDTLLGMHGVAQSIIKITKTYGGKSLSWRKLHEILIHEILHAVEYMYSYGGQIEHFKLNQLSVGWNQVLADNRLDLKGPYMPKSVMIGGLQYKIAYPYIFKNEINAVHGTHHNEETLLRLSGSNDDGKYSTTFVKINLVELINFSIANVYIGKWDDDLGRRLNRLAHGLHQVIVDNNLEELIQNGIKADKLRK